jgi:hypothetical protein
LGHDFGNNNPIPKLENGYFMKKKFALHNPTQGRAGAIAPVRDTVDQPLLDDPTPEGIKHQFDMPPEVDLTSPINDKIDPRFLGGPDRQDL